MGKKQGSTETKNDFRRGSKKREAEEDKYIGAITNVPLWRQFHLYIVCSWKQISPYWKYYCKLGVGLLEQKSDLYILWLQCNILLDSSSVPFLPGFSKGKSFFSSSSRESSNQVWHSGSCPCALGLCGSWWPAKMLCQREELTASSAAVLCWASRPQVKGRVAGAVSSGVLLRANTHAGARDIQYMHDRSSSHRRTHKRIGTTSVLLHALRWTGVGSCPFWLLLCCSMH